MLLSSKTLLLAVLSSPAVNAWSWSPRAAFEEFSSTTGIGAPKRQWVSSAALQKGIKEKGLLKNLENLYEIALANGGNRAFGLPGYDASVDFIYNRVKRSPTSVAWKQDFPALFNFVESISLTIDGVSYYVFGPTYSPSTSAEGITAELVLGPTGDAGCTVEGYAGFDVTDKIVLVQRGRCPDGTTFAGRMKPAAAAGAASVIIYNNIETNITAATLSNPDPVNYVPTGSINLVDALPIVARLEAGETLQASFQQTQTIETRITQNVFAETKEGDPNNVIVIGAHLDGVQAGAGINDDGSGTSLILEIFTALQNFKVKNKVRFAWWGAEENGLLGSEFYTQNLTDAEASNVLAYLNFDMVSRGFFGVFDGDGSTYNYTPPAGSDVLEKLFTEHLTGKGLTVTPVALTNGSDYGAFLEFLGTPVGGLHTGTGVAQDPCYHQACDTYDNANGTVLTINAKAAAHVLSILAIDGQKIIPKANRSVPSAVERRNKFKKRGEKHARHAHHPEDDICGGGI